MFFRANRLYEPTVIHLNAGILFLVLFPGGVINVMPFLYGKISPIQSQVSEIKLYLSRSFAFDRMDVSIYSIEMIWFY